MNNFFKSGINYPLILAAIILACVAALIPIFFMHRQHNQQKNNAQSHQKTLLDQIAKLVTEKSFLEKECQHLQQEAERRNTRTLPLK